MSNAKRPTENKFRRCYAAALFAHDATMRQFAHRLAYDGVVLIDHIVAYRKNDFLAKYRPTERTKKALLTSLQQMGLQFAD